jgi:hypothetical protein
MCPAIGMPMCACDDVPMCGCGESPSEFYFFMLLALRSVYPRPKRSDKSVNPLNPGSNRRCRYADVQMCGCADMRMCGCADACPVSKKRSNQSTLAHRHIGTSTHYHRGHSGTLAHWHIIIGGTPAHRHIIPGGFCFRRWLLQQRQLWPLQ